MGSAICALLFYEAKLTSTGACIEATVVCLDGRIKNSAGARKLEILRTSGYLSKIRTLCSSLKILVDPRHCQKSSQSVH